MTMSSNDSRSLAGRVAVVTGAGQGIGRAVSLRLAAAGVDVVCADIDEEAARAVATEVGAVGRRALGLGTDVADPERVQGLAAAALEQMGHVDILVNNAGISERAPAASFPLEAWHRILAVNLTGAFLCARAFGQHMIDRGAGRIVNLASIGGLAGYANSVAYLASKGGVVQLTRALAVEWAEHGITVNAVAPGPVDTPLLHALRDEPDSGFQRMLDGMALKGFIQPEHVAAAVNYLVSDDARLVTGAILPVDGGYLAR